MFKRGGESGITGPLIIDLEIDKDTLDHYICIGDGRFNCGEKGEINIMPEVPLILTSQKLL